MHLYDLGSELSEQYDLRPQHLDSDIQDFEERGYPS
jgi:hypothetical protein